MNHAIHMHLFFGMVQIMNNFLQMIAGPLLSVIHVYSVIEEMRAAPVNTLNPQRTAMIVADFIKVGYGTFNLLFMYFSFFI